MGLRWCQRQRQRQRQSQRRRGRAGWGRACGGERGVGRRRRRRCWGWWARARRGVGCWSGGGRAQSECWRRARAARRSGGLGGGVEGGDAPSRLPEACLDWTSCFSNQLSRATGMGSGIAGWWWGSGVFRGRGLRRSAAIVSSTRAASAAWGQCVQEGTGAAAWKQEESQQQQQQKEEKEKERERESAPWTRRRRRRRRAQACVGYSRRASTVPAEASGASCGRSPALACPWGPWSPSPSRLRPLTFEKCWRRWPCRPMFATCSRLRGRRALPIGRLAGRPPARRALSALSAAIARAENKLLSAARCLLSRAPCWQFAGESLPCRVRAAIGCSRVHGECECECVLRWCPHPIPPVRPYPPHTTPALARTLALARPWLLHPWAQGWAHAGAARSKVPAWACLVHGLSSTAAKKLCAGPNQMWMQPPPAHAAIRRDSSPVGGVTISRRLSARSLSLSLSHAHTRAHSPTRSSLAAHAPPRGLLITPPITQHLL